jgi:heat shock protein beta
MRLSHSSFLLVLLSQLVSSFQEEVASGSKVNLDVPLAEAGDLMKKVATGGKKFEFQSDVTRLLKIFAEHMYVSDEAFMRELIANSCDAIRKQRQAVMKASLDGGLEDDSEEYRVVVRADKEQGILTVTDNGVGMTHDELKEFLGTIAKSGTSKFNLENPSKNADVSNFIGQFGVGFYSVLLVADQVMVISKNDADKKQWIWESDASASFSLAEDPRGNTLKRGTQIVLKLKPKASRFLEDNALEKVMKQYFEHDANNIYLVKHVEEEVPITEESSEKMEEEKKKKDDVEIDETEELKEYEDEEKKPKTKKVAVEKLELISQKQKPIWKRDPSELKAEDYNALYHTLTKEKADPLEYIHVKAEGDLDFRSILFIPKRPPFHAFAAAKGVESLIKLHVRGVFVTAKLDDFLPKYLSFVRGIIDSDDLPLNISRDMLQSNDGLRTVQKKIVSKVLEMIDNLSKDEEKYKEFFDAYGSHLKLEVIDNERYRNKISKLLRYESSNSNGKYVSLSQYLENAKANEKHGKKKTIYFLSGSSKAEIEKSPFLEKLKSVNFEVLYLTDTVDEHCIQVLREFDDWKFQSIAKDGLDLDDESDEAAKKAFEEEFKPLSDYMGKVLKDDVEKVVISTHLSNSPSAVVANQFGWTGNMERVMMSQTNSKDDPMMAFFAMQKKIFEINPKNELIKGMLERAKVVSSEKKPDPYLRISIKALYDATMIWSGYNVKDTKRFARSIDSLARKALGINDVLEPEPVEEEKKDDEKAPLDINFSEDDDADLKAADKKGESPKGPDAEKKEEESSEHIDL